MRDVIVGLSDFERVSAVRFSGSRNGAECRSEAARTRAATSASDIGGDTAGFALTSSMVRELRLPRQGLHGRKLRLLLGFGIP